MMIPILAWLTTLDTNGYDAQQLKAIPYNLWFHAYMNQKTEFDR